MYLYQLHLSHPCQYICISTHLQLSQPRNTAVSLPATPLLTHVNTVQLYPPAGLSSTSTYLYLYPPPTLSPTSYSCVSTQQ
jgi:hypothetical protein